MKLKAIRSFFYGNKRINIGDTFEVTDSHAIKFLLGGKMVEKVINVKPVSVEQKKKKVSKKRTSKKSK